MGFWCVARKARTGGLIISAFMELLWKFLLAFFIRQFKKTCESFGKPGALRWKTVQLALLYLIVILILSTLLVELSYAVL
jgi:glucose-6-phosphate-specific signal transduction histidine kinase